MYLPRSIPPRRAARLSALPGTAPHAERLPLGVLSACLLAASLLLGACEEAATPKGPLPAPAPDEVVLRTGDFEFTEAELNASVAFVRSLDAQAAPALARRLHLRDWLLPQRIARRLADPARLADVERRARELHAAVMASGGDVASLMRLGEPFGGQETDGFMTPLPRLPIDIARAAWEVPVGGVTEVLASAYGFAIVGVLDERPREAPLTGTERRLYTVFFPLSPDETFRPEVLRERDRLLGEIRYVHPAYRDEFAAAPPASR